MMAHTTGNLTPPIETVNISPRPSLRASSLALRILAARIGRKRLFLISVAGFTFTSVLCGVAQSLPEMVLFRLLQGVFGAGLAYSHFRTRSSREREEKVVEVYPEGFSTRNAPFPLVLTLTIAGTIIWAFFYILVTGILGVKI